MGLRSEPSGMKRTRLHPSWAANLSRKAGPLQGAIANVSRTHSVHSSPTDSSGKQRTKAVPPKSNRLEADINAAFVRQVFHISKRKWITHIHHNRQADDLRARLEVLEWVAFCHPATLGVPLTHFNQVSSDSAE